MNKYIYTGLGVLVVIVGVWFVFFRSPTTPTQQEGALFGEGGVNPSEIPNTTNSATNVLPDTEQQTAGVQTIFKIAEGPVAAATFVQTTQPTTTLARYINQTNGHIFDLAVDVPGAVARPVSNTTVPGIAVGQWGPRGEVVLLRYIDGATKKSLLISLVKTATSSSNTPRIRFLPDDVIDVALSPDGKRVAYLLQGAAGAEGYIAASDGSATKRVFSLPLSQLILTWPSPSTLLLYTNSSASIPGVLFSVNTTTGVVSPLFHAQGLTATANRDFSRIIYQISSSLVAASYVRDTKTGLSRELSFDPFPEKCVWSNIVTFALYCAKPLSYVAPSYLDTWHSGTENTPDSLFGFNLQSERSFILAVPGSEDGGEESDILSLAVSPDDKYLLFVKKGDRSLWGVRLGN